MASGDDGNGAGACDSGRFSTLQCGCPATCGFPKSPLYGQRAGGQRRGRRAAGRRWQRRRQCRRRRGCLRRHIQAAAHELGNTGNTHWCNCCSCKLPRRPVQGSQARPRRKKEEKPKNQKRRSLRPFFFSKNGQKWPKKGGEKSKKTCGNATSN